MSFFASKQNKLYPLCVNPFRRYLLPFVESDLKEKMVFVSGPRQVGKTTLAKQILENQPGIYLNWDNRQDRRKILNGLWPPDPALIVLDELHKYRKWKAHLKGEYDRERHRHTFLVTGSARLNIYRRGGDSLQGRYHSLRMHPFSLAELLHESHVVEPGQKITLPKKGTSQEKLILETLLNYGGFPEPFLKAEARFHRRWQKERLDRVISEDVRDLSNISDLSALQILADLLPARAGALLSLNNLRMDIEVSHRAVTHWMNIFEQLYYCYRLTPYSARLANTLRKERKLYLWDWSSLEDPGARFENMIAGHLLKFCHSLEDTEGYRVELHYIRDKSKREVDFLVTYNKKPWFAVEAKRTLGRDHHLLYFGQRMNIPQLFYVYLEESEPYQKEKVVYAPVGHFLRALGI